MVSFSRRERREFVRNGFLVRDDLLSSDLVDAASREIVDAIDVDPDDPEQVVGEGYDVAAEGIDEGPLDDIVETLLPAVEALVGEGVLAPPSGGMQVALNFPEDHATDPVPRPDSVDGHLDGYANFDENPEVWPFTVSAVVYVGDVPPRGGGFTVWPGSHRVAANYFEDHALEAIGGKPHNSQLPAVGEEPGEWDYDQRLFDQYDPYEIAGDAGTVVLWHSKLTHNAGINSGEDVRMAAIKRFRRTDEDEIMRDAATDPFAYWPAMTDVPLVEDADSFSTSPEES